MRRFRGIAVALILVAFCCGCGGGGNSASTALATLSATTTATKALSGQYALLLNGYDDFTGNPMAIAGSITADGNGHVTSGSMDVNDGLVNSSGPVTGAYAADVNTRGTISFLNTFGSVRLPMTFAFSLKADGSAGVLIGLDNNGFLVSGTIVKQDSTAFSQSSLAGNFVYESDSRLPVQVSDIGRFTLTSSGAITNGIEDSSVAGTGPAATTAQVAGQLLTPNTNGRGTASITEAGTTRNFVYYIVSATRIFAMETDPNIGATSTLYTAVAVQQNIPSTPNTPGSVFTVAGLDTNPSATPNIPNAIAAIGTLAINGSTANLGWDSNDAGGVFGPESSTQTANPTTVSYDPTTGRGTIAFVTAGGGVGNGLFDSAVFYLSGAGTGVMLDTTAGSNNRAMAGSFQPQTTIGAFGAASFSANSIGVGEVGAPVATATAEDLILAPGSGLLSGYDDASGQGVDFSIVFTYSASGINATSGRGTFSSGLNSDVFYFVGPNQYVFLGNTTGTAARYFTMIPQ